MVTTAFGKAELAEEVTLKQRANGKQFETLVQLLEDEKGNLLVRFAYATDGVARRGPVTLRRADLERSADGAEEDAEARRGARSRRRVSEPERDVDVPPPSRQASGRTTSTSSATSST